MKKKFIFFALVAILSIGILSVASAAFSDVSVSTQYADAIKYAETNGIVSGYPDGSFKPLSRINRAEFTKIIVGATTGYNPSQDPSGYDIYALVGVSFSDAVSGE